MNRLRKYFSPRYILGRILISSILGNRVKTGPFKGTKLKKNVNLNLFYSKLLGVYEMELNQVILSILYKRFRSIIVVGTAEGYYFSGLLRFARFDQIVGFEMDDGLREICNHNAKKNCQGKNFSLLGTCFIEELKQTTRGNDLILMDCEGEEETLLNPNEIPSLYKTEIIVECHDIFRPKITETLQKRFSNSHNITKIQARNPSHRDFPFLPVFLTNYLRHTITGILTERPPHMHWLHLTPK